MCGVYIKNYGDYKVVMRAKIVNVVLVICLAVSITAGTGGQNEDTESNKDTSGQ